MKGRIWLAFGAAILLTGGLAWILERSLARPVDWFGRWSAESDRTEDRALGHAALDGGARYGPGKIGRGLDLGERQSRAVLDSWGASGGFSLEFWLNPRRVKSARTKVCEVESGETPPFGMVLEKGELCIAYGQAGPGAKLIHSGVFPPTNVWTHAVAVSDGRDFRMHIDGKLAISRSEPGLHPRIFAITFGRGAPNPPEAGYFGDTEHFDGSIDEIGFYARALDTAEARQLWLATAWNPAVRRSAIEVLEAICFGLALGTLALAAANLSRASAPGADAPDRPFGYRQFRVVFGLVAVGSTLSALAFLRLGNELPKTGYDRLREASDRFCEQFDDRTEMYALRFMGVRDWIEVREDISPTQWMRFVHAASLFSESPGLVEIGFAPAVAPTERLRHESAWSAYYPGYRIHPDLAAGERGGVILRRPAEAQPHFPVVLQLDSASAKSWNPQFDAGLDLTALGKDATIPGSELWTMLYACNIRSIGAAVGGAWGGRHFLKNSSDKVARLYFSVARNEGEVVGRDSKALRGMLFASIDWREFFRHAFEYGGPSLSFKLSMNDGPNAVLMLDSRNTGDDAADNFKLRRTVRFYRNRVYFEFSASRASLLGDQLRWPWLIGGAGMAATLLAAGLLLVQVRARIGQEAVSAQLRASREELQAALKDRERISRDLHDGTMQSIYAVTLGLGRCLRLIGNRPAAASAQIEQSLVELRSVNAELREFLLTLEPETLQGRSFPAVLESLVERLQRTTGTRLNLRHGEGIAANLSPREAIHLLNIVREATSNSLRHGGPKEVWITLSETGGSLRLGISDDGRGFDPALPSEGHGLRNMAERASEIGADFEVDSAPGRGARVVVLLPPGRAATEPSRT